MLVSDSQITVTLKHCAWTLRHRERAMGLPLKVHSAHSAHNSRAVPWKGNHFRSGKQRGEMKDQECSFGHDKRKMSTEIHYMWPGVLLLSVAASGWHICWWSNEKLRKHVQPCSLKMQQRCQCILSGDEQFHRVGDKHNPNYPSASGSLLNLNGLEKNLSVFVTSLF